MFQQPVNEFQILLKAFSYFRTHWWVFVLEVLAIYGVSLHKFYRTPPVYQSDSSILIDSSRRQLYQSVMLPAMAGSQNSKKQNMVHLLTSQEVMERFRTQLTELYNTESRPAYLKAFFPGGVAYPGDVLRTWVVLNWDRNSDIYSIQCSANNPNAAHDLCLAYMNTIQSYYPEIGQRDAMMKRDFLRRQIASFTRQISDREQRIAKFQKENPEFINFIMTNIEERAIQKFRAERNATRQRIAANRAVYRLMLNIPKAKKGEHSARTTAITQLTQQVSEIQYQIQLTEASQEPTRDQRLARLKDELGEVSAQLAKLNEEEVATFLKNPLPAAAARQRLTDLELEYRIDKIKLEEVEKSIEEIATKEKRFNTERLEYERLLTELNHKKKLLTNLYQKEQETELEISAGNAEIFRLQEPSLSGHRTAPQLSRHLYAGFSLSLFLVVVSVVLLVAFFPRLDSETEVHRLNLPVLGKVPVLRGFNPHSDEIPGYSLEYLKIMNYRILRETKDMKCPVLIVSSPHAREGKSTVTRFLGLASQSPTRKTLLIDGDLLTAHPNKFFGIPDDFNGGLRTILEDTTGKIDPHSMVVQTTHEGLSFMPRGSRFDPIAMPNLLKPVERMLDQFRKEYDLIFIDTPPLFASNLAHQWAGLGDLIILVARIYYTRPKDIVEAIQTCKVFSKSPVGVALNCVPLSGGNRRASHYYYFSRRRVKPTKTAA